MKLIIEPGTNKDIDELELLYNDLIDYLNKNVNYPGWIKDIYPTRQNAIDGITENNLYIAKYNDKIVGTIILSHNPEPEYHEAKWSFESDYKEVFVIHTFAVHPEYTKCGIGKDLMIFAEQLGKEQGMKAIRLDVYENNVPAVQLYEKCGYKYIGKVDLGYEDYGLKWFKLYEKIIS